VSEDEGLRLPFLWEGVTLHATGATAARVRISPTGGDSYEILVADASGTPVAVADSLMLRPVTAEQLASAAAGPDSLYRLEWTAAPASETVTAEGVARYADLAAAHAVFTGPEADADQEVPHVVLVPVTGVEHADDPAEAGGRTVAEVLAFVQRWLGDERLTDTRLVLVTRGAVATDGGDVADLAAAPVWGLIRSAQSENPGRLVLVDTDPAEDTDDELVRRAALLGEPQVAVREGRVLVPRLARAASGEGLVPPADTAAWRLDSSGEGTLEGLALVPAPEAEAPLAPGQVRIAVRAAGVNFRDVLMSLGMYPGQLSLGSEAAGVVLDVADDVSEFVPGDRVLGL
ncbi:alcohol dehydrogenase catalytic domain-containing protein, partial [Streptomyces sp. NPDC093991]